MTTVNIHEAKTHLSRLVDRVAKGEQIIIAKAGKPVALLTPLPGTTKRRVPGIDKGTVVGDDWDDPIPDLDEYM